MGAKLCCRNTDSPDQEEEDDDHIQLFNNFFVLKSDQQFLSEHISVTTDYFSKYVDMGKLLFYFNDMSIAQVILFK